MNWLAKLDGMVATIKDMAVNHWQVATALGLMVAVVAVIIAAVDPDRKVEMRKKIRIFRYCHNCPYADLYTETCSIEADNLERCGVIDRKAGMSFTVTKN